MVANNYIIISMLTPKYRDYANDLKADLDSLGLPYLIEEYEDTGDYVGNHLLKPLHIQKMLKELKSDILWLDVDCRVHGALDYIDNEFKGDVGAVMFKNNLRGTRKKPQMIPFPNMCTATMYLRNKEVVNALVDTWVENLNPVEDAVSIVQFDWNNLFRMAQSVTNITFEELPFEYCWVWSGDEENNMKFENTKPIIEQYAASVVFRDKDESI